MSFPGYDVKLINVVLSTGYGPSETTNICTIKPNIRHTDHMNNIGKPLENMSAFVASDSPVFSLVPKGGVGELCFGGEQVVSCLPDTIKSFLTQFQLGMWVSW